MGFYRQASLLSLYILLVAAESTKLYPNAIKDIHGSHSSETLEVLAVHDMHKGSIQFDSYEPGYSGLFVFQYYPIIPVSEVKLTFSFLGEAYSFDFCLFPFDNLACKTWRGIANMSSIDLEWTTITYSLSWADYNLSSIFSPSGQILLRFYSPYSYNSCYLDFAELELIAIHPSGATPPPHVLAPRQVASSSASKTTSATILDSIAAAINGATAGSAGRVASSIAGAASSITRSASVSGAASSNTASTGAASSVAGGKAIEASVSGASTSGDARTRPYTTSSSSGSPTVSPTSSSGATTAKPVPLSGVSVNFALKFLVLYKSTSQKLNWVKLACDGIGMPCVYVSISSSTSLSSSLTTSGVGAYAGIVSVGHILSTSQMDSVIAYQNTYSVKFVVVGSDPTSVNGLERSPRGVTSLSGTISIASQFQSFAKSVRLDLTLPTQGTMTPVMITDTAIASPALLVTLGSDTYVLAAQITSPSLQLHYFIEESPDNIHSRAYIALFINWLAPAGVYQGIRRIFVNPQADDFFLPTFLWDMDSNSNPFTKTYRMNSTDLRNLVSHLQRINSLLPQGSNVTVEWPYNGNGISDAGGYDVDELYTAAKELQSKFFFLSHTFRHPCTLDTDTYDYAYEELSLNIPVAQRLLSAGTASPYYSSTSMVNPCITGLFNPEVLRAMKANGIYNAVGDNSVPKLVSPNPYHIIETTEATHGEPGVFIIPRHVTDIYYDVSTPEESADEYNFIYGTDYTYQEVLEIQVNIAINHLLAYRHDPTMFHQLNGRSFRMNGQIVSHLGNWIEGVSVGIAQFYTLPVWTIKEDSLAEVWKQRTTMDNAGFNVILKITDGSIAGVWTNSNSNCTGAANVRQEWYGPEITSYIKQTAGIIQYFPLTTPVHL